MPLSALKNLPAKAKDIWEAAFKQAQKDGHSDERAAKMAWGAVKNAGYAQDKDSGKWHKMDLLPFYITKASKGADGIMRWAATVSEFSIDRQGDEMTPEFIKAAVGQWHAGLRPDPVVCISHIDHGRPADAWAAGDVTDLYVDGNTPKAKGTFRDTPLGRAAFAAVRRDWADKVPRDQRARISMGFFADQIQPIELKADNGATVLGRRFMSGWVKHLAITRVPVVQSTEITAEMELKAMATPKTKKEDAATIVGPELAQELVEMAAKSDLEAETPDMILKQDDKPGAAGKGKPRKVKDDEEEETTGEMPPEEVEGEAPPPEEEEEDAEKKKKKAPEAKAATGSSETDPGAARMDQLERLIDKLVAALGLEEIQPEETQANRLALGFTSTNPPTNAKGDLTDVEAYMQAMSNGETWEPSEHDHDHEQDPEGDEYYEFSDYSGNEYQYTVIRFIDDWGDRVKAALLSDGDRTEKVAAVQKALNDFGDGVQDLIRDATPPSSRDLADVVSEAVRAAVGPVYNELAAVKAELEQYRAGNAGYAQGMQPKALDNSAIVLETALQQLTSHQNPGAPPAGLGRGRTIEAKSASDLAWESTNPAAGGYRGY